MPRLLRTIVMAISTTMAAPVDAGEGGSVNDVRPPSAASNPVPPPDDDGPVLPPWQRPDAVEPEVGVDDDPTTFDPGVGPTAPEPD
jgi:hypothetical protein